MLTFFAILHKIHSGFVVTFPDFPTCQVPSESFEEAYGSAAAGLRVKQHSIGAIEARLERPARPVREEGNEEEGRRREEAAHRSGAARDLAHPGLAQGGATLVGRVSFEGLIF